jgi:hypothetical protein
MERLKTSNFDRISGLELYMSVQHRIFAGLRYRKNLADQVLGDLTVNRIVLGRRSSGPGLTAHIH